MKEEIVKKRKWVVPAAFAFMGVLLVLTFFSNTIMNRSLPEVAAQYTQSGTITARIRGSGTVTANESFEVKNGSQARRVSERPVTKGDEVKIGDVLVRFDVDISADLETAKNDLKENELKLEKMLLDMSRPGSISNSAVQAARNALTDAQRTLSEAQRTLSMLPGYDDASIAAAQVANDQAQAALNAATSTAAARLYELQIAEAELALLDSADPAYAAAEAKVQAAQFASSAANATESLAQSNFTAANNSLTTQQTNRANRIAASQNVTAANQNVTSAQQSLADAVLAQSDDQANANIESSKEAIDLRELRRSIEEQKEKIEKLEKEGSITEITSLVAGIVTKVDVTPGDTVDPEETLMVIEVVDRGYSLSFNVTSEQANRVSPGDPAEVDRGWWSWGDDIRATLTHIRNDPQNPATGRILVFSVTGDVESDMQLNLTLAQRSENYNIIVPNSAVRTDTNGDFVLIIMTRSTPVGNRHIATRADITVIASDDTNSAIAGALSGWDFVITRASEPIEPGMQVRLTDNP